MYRIIGAGLFLLSFWLLSSSGISVKETTQWESSSNVFQLLTALGETQPKHFQTSSAEQIRQGEEMVKYGRTTLANGKKSRYISKYYVCTTCHNLEQEDPNLRFSNPETRLPYVKQKGIPFLQGTTFRGIVNRETWYNDDYVKKYGAEKIGKAHHDLRESIQLCAVECSQGRPMEPWEIDAVLAYYWTLQWKLRDLDLSESDYLKINTAIKDPSQKESLLKWIKSYYLQKSPATFYDAPPDKKAGYASLKGDAAVGKDLYELSCLHCHKPDGVSHYILDESSFSFQNLKNNIPRDSHMSLYQIVAYGTYAIPGHRPYMPHYPQERMSQQQVEDLRAYIEQMADQKHF